MLTGEPHSTTVTALTEVVAYAVHPEHLAPLLADHPELYEQLSHNVAVRHLRFQQGLASFDDPQQSHEVHSIAAQIVDRMRALFHTAGHDRVALVDGEPAVPEPAAPPRSPAARAAMRR